MPSRAWGTPSSTPLIALEHGRCGSSVITWRTATNAFLPMKVALTASNPLVMKLGQDAFAALPHAKLPIAPSLSIREAVHARWTVVCHSIGGADWQRPFVHAEL